VMDCGLDGDDELVVDDGVDGRHACSHIYWRIASEIFILGIVSLALRACKVRSVRPRR
jgi:hypothetical protein